MARQSILFVLTSHDRLGNTDKPTGYHLAEVSHPYYVLAEAGYTIEFATPKGGPAPVDPASVDREDPDNARFLEDEITQNKLANTLAAEQVDAERYLAVYFAGGHGTMWDLPDNPMLAEVIRTVYDNGGIVAAVCHGPAALVNVSTAEGRPLVEGKRVSAFTDEEERAVGLDEVVPFLLADVLRQRGARHEAAPDFEEQVTEDARLVTGQNPASARGVGERIRDLLAG